MSSCSDTVTYHTCLDGDGKVCKVVFSIDRSGSSGILHFSHETFVGYDLRTKTWTGDEINADGWVDLDADEINDLVKEYSLENLVKEAIKNDSR